MFKYNHSRDRFVPDRHRSPYSFYSQHHSTANHQYDCESNCGEESEFLEPFECERQQEQKHRAFRQLQSYMSLDSTGGHLLRHVLKECNNSADKIDLATLYRDVDLTWPIRMVGKRRLARKSNQTTNKSLVADLLLDMPNLSNDSMTKILDWSATGYLTAAIQSSIHLWSCRTQSVQYTIDAVADGGSGSAKPVVGCVKWDAQGVKLGYSFAVERDEEPSFDSSGSSSPHALLERTNAARDPQHADVTYRSPSTADSSVDETSRRNSAAAAAAKRAGPVKVWLLNAGNNNSNHEQKTSNCGCESDEKYQWFNGCKIIVMDWLANGRVLVTGCTRATVTFFRYDFAQKKLIVILVLHKSDRNSIITCLHVSQDKWSRHLAVATYSHRACILRVWRIKDLLELGPADDADLQLSIDVTHTLTDRYDSKRSGQSNWLIKAFAWHPWKHALMCYAVTSTPRDGMHMYVNPKSPSWFVLANACKGQVLKRIEQTASNCCPTMNILHVNTHSMTFSRLTGELLVSATTVYSVKDSAYSSPILIDKHSVVVMHALDRIVETLSSSQTDRGLFFAWSPDGKRIALTSSDESLRIWNFWPSGNVQQKTNNRPSHVYTTNATSTVNSAHQTEDLNNNNNYRLLHNQSSQNSHTAMSELSLDAARIIK
ncbi:Protein cortex [Aphis craccivora]|uniref:Protein cortex n=1 Tax=Aphis craccivora TaxID=307492 RepID=A0A6G0YCE5_APHCR|nr:Protein cortex [Aphis craccivora]